LDRAAVHHLMWMNSLTTSFTLPPGDLLEVRPQDLHLFDATIHGNLRLARPDATDEELETAAACARQRPWITSLPPGWETSVGTHGAAVAVSCHAR
jgi:ABC-type transport system involved in cytochrome bd biosynthesis fused ATPase/permease subunit